MGCSLEDDNEIDGITQVLEDMIVVVGELTIERDLFKQMYDQEKEAKEALALELEEALVRVARLDFYLENY